MNKIVCTICFLLFCILGSGQLFAQKKSLPAKFKQITVSTESNAAIWVDDFKFGVADSDGKLAIIVPQTAKRIMIRADGFKEFSALLARSSNGKYNFPLTKTTDSAELAFQEGERLSQLDRDNAVVAYQKAIKLKPRYLAPQIAILRIYSARGDNDAALKLVTEIRKIGPNAETSAVEGRVYHSMAADEKAIASFKRSITEGKGYQPEAYTGLGLLYKDKAEDSENDEAASANLAQAVKYLSTAVEQLAGSTDAPVVYQLLGLIYEQQKQFKKATTLYNEFLGIFPDSPEAPAIRSFIVQINKQLETQK